MFKDFISTKILIYFLVVSSVMLNSCKKDDNELGSVNRIVSMIYYENDVFKNKTTMTYNDEKITRYDEEIIYNGETIHAWSDVTYMDSDSIEFKYYRGNESRPFSKTLFEIRNGNVSSIGYFDIVHGDIYKRNILSEYSYLNNILTEETLYLDGSGSSMDPWSKTINEIVDNKFIRSFHYDFENDWVLSGIDTIIYSGNKPDTRINYQVPNGIKHEWEKFVYFYNGNILTQIDYYKSQAGTWVLEENIYFSYNEFGNLVSKKIQLAPNAIVSYEFEYEGGKGNYKQLMDPGSDFWDPMLLPTPD